MYFLIYFKKMGNGASTDRKKVEEGWLTRLWNWVKEAGIQIISFLTSPPVEAGLCSAVAIINQFVPTPIGLVISITRFGMAISIRGYFSIGKEDPWDFRRLREN